jgi:hypothetical protein
MVYAMVAPTLSFGLLPTAVAAEGYSGLLRSATTRRPGLVTATDLAPTALDHLGLALPAEMQGQPATSVPAAHPEARLRALNNRQEDVTERRIPALALTLAAWVLLLAALAVGRRPGAVRAGLRLGFLALVWLPSLGLVTAVLDPPEWGEYAFLGLGSLLLAAACDRWLPWPGAPALPVAIMLVAHTIDLIGNSALIVGSLAGPTPRGGARFFGIGNELETMLSVGVLLGTGALLAWRPSTRAALVFAAVAAVTAVVIGAGALGADVGGVITLGAGGAVAVLASLPGGPSRRAIVIAALTPLLALAALVLIDLATGGNAHFTRFVLDAGGPGQLVDTLTRRFDLAWSILLSGTRPYSVAAFVAVIVYGLWRREQLLAPMRAALGDRAAELYAAGVYGTLAAIVVGSLANDSGPIIFLIGAVAVVLATAYAWAVPDRRGPVPAPG